MQLPENDHDFSNRINLKGKFSRLVPNFINVSKSHTLRKERGVWQRRFWEHIIPDENDFKSHFDYVHYNPVKHGYVKKCIDWPHSSFHRYVEQGIYSADWGDVVEEKKFNNFRAGE